MRREMSTHVAARSLHRIPRSTNEENDHDDQSQSLPDVPSARCLLWAPLSKADDYAAPVYGYGESRSERDQSRRDRWEERVERRGGQEGSGRHEELNSREGTEVTNGRHQKAARNGGGDGVGVITKGERPAKCEGDPSDC